MLVGGEIGGGEGVVYFVRNTVGEHEVDAERVEIFNIGVVGNIIAEDVDLSTIILSKFDILLWGLIYQELLPRSQLNWLVWQW